MKTVAKNLLENKHKLRNRTARNKIVIDSGHSNLEAMTKVGLFLPVNLVLRALRRHVSKSLAYCKSCLRNVIVDLKSG